MTEKTGNIGFKEDRDEYEAENIIWVPKEANSLPALEGKAGGEFWTSTIIIKTVVEMIKPW